MNCSLGQLLKRPARNSTIHLLRRLCSTSSSDASDSLPVKTDVNTSQRTQKSCYVPMNSQPLVEHLQNAQSTELQPSPEFPSDLDTYHRQSQERHAFRPKVDPQQTSILLFPGQGSQFVGMGGKLLPYPNVKEMYELASEVLGYDLLDLCLNGPKSRLDKTVYCQPAVMVTSLAAVERLKNENPVMIERCVGAAGFSVGEYSALVFAGALSLENALHLVKVRGEAMQAASEATPSGMVSVFTGHQSQLGLACQMAKQYCQKKLGITEPVCEVANYLYPECTVIAGNDEALHFLEQNAKEFGLRRMKRLAVSGAFHTKLMIPARDLLTKAIKQTEVSAPLIPVYSNMSSHWYRNTSGIIKMLPQQVCKPVKWEQIMHVVYSRKRGENFPVTYEVGPGRQLGTILQKVNQKAYKSYHSVEV